MKPLLLAFLLCSTGFQPAIAGSGLELTLSRPHSGIAVPGRWIGSLSYFRLRVYPVPGFTEWGVTAMPPIRVVEEGKERSGKVDSFIGVYSGHVFPVWGGLIRPGFQIGSIWEEEWNGERDTQGRLALYYAFHLQFSCLSFILSSQGQGFGFNFNL